MPRGVARRLICLVGFSQMLICLPEVVADDRSDFGRHVHRRSGFENSRVRFKHDRTGRVAFVGGSITEMQGYRPLVMEDLRRRFPQTEFDFINAGIASTCSTTGAFRLNQDVLSAGPVDLLFVEFAVNDDQDAGHERRECIRGMEGILRKALAGNPNMDVVVTHFVNPQMLPTLQDGGTPLTMSAHEQVAEHYRVSTIALASEVAAQISSGTLTWEEYGGTHPGMRGNQLCAEMIAEMLDDAWRDPLAAGARLRPHAVPDHPIDRHSYFRGHFVPRDQVHLEDRWSLKTPDWSQLPGACRDRFRERVLICATEPEAELSVEFDGTAVGAYLLAGPDAGILLASIDGGPFEEFNLYHRFSRGLHYPRTIMFAADLADGPHVLKLRTASEIVEPSTGLAARVIDFVAN